MKAGLAERYHWSLYDINRTDIFDLLRFIFRVTGASGGAGPKPKDLVYCDQVSWL